MSDHAFSDLSSFVCFLCKWTLCFSSSIHIHSYSFNFYVGYAYIIWFLNTDEVNRLCFWPENVHCRNALMFCIVMLILRIMLCLPTDDWWPATGDYSQRSWHVYISSGDCLSLCDGRPKIWRQLRVWEAGTLRANGDTIWTLNKT